MNSVLKILTSVGALLMSSIDMNSCSDEHRDMSMAFQRLLSLFFDGFRLGMFLTFVTRNNGLQGVPFDNG